MLRGRCTARMQRGSGSRAVMMRWAGLDGAATAAAVSPRSSSIALARWLSRSFFVFHIRLSVSSESLILEQYHSCSKRLRGVLPLAGTLSAPSRCVSSRLCWCFREIASCASRDWAALSWSSTLPRRVSSSQCGERRRLTSVAAIGSTAAPYGKQAVRFAWRLIRLAALARTHAAVGAAPAGAGPPSKQGRLSSDGQTLASSGAGKLGRCRAMAIENCLDVRGINFVS